MNRALLLAIAAYVISFFHRAAPSTLAMDLSASFQISGAVLGALSATYFYVYVAMQLPAGVLVDTWGVKWVLVLGSASAGVGAVLMALAPSFTVAVIGRLLVGLGVSVAFVSMLKIISLSYPPERFATLVGLCMFIGNGGAIVAGAPLAAALDWVHWRVVLALVGLLSLLLAAASWRVLSKNLVHAQKVDWRSWFETLTAVVLTRSSLWGILVTTGIGGALFGFGGLWAVPYFKGALGFSSTQAAWVLSLFYLGFAAGAPLVGTLSDRWGRRKSLMLSLLGGYAAVWLLLWQQPAGWGFAAMAALMVVMGLLAAGMTLSWAIAKDEQPPERSGMATSVVNLGVFLGPALLQPWVGHVMERLPRAASGHYEATHFAAGFQWFFMAALLAWLAAWQLPQDRFQKAE